MRNRIVYLVWVMGRDIDNNDNHFPINSNIGSRDWRCDFKLACDDYFKAEVINHVNYEDIYSDYIITLFNIEINIVEFESKYGIKFDLTNDKVLELIPY